MDISNFIIMKHELLLTLAALILLIAEIAIDNKKRIIPFAIILFGTHTIYGFFDNNTGEVFGGMYQNSALIILMKNILNIGVFIILLQASTWLLKEKNKAKISEFLLVLGC